MKSLMIALLILPVLLIEAVLTLGTIVIYPVLIKGDYLTKKLIDKL